MNKDTIRIIGDLHIGKTMSHTTPASRKRFQVLQDEVIKKAFDCDYPIFQLGDVFDKFEVNSSDFIRGLQTRGKSTGMLKGNHDYSNDTTLKSAFDNMSGFYKQDEIHSFSDASLKLKGVITMISHQSNNAEFKKRLDEAYTTALEAGKKKLLLLHCNVGEKDEPEQLDNYLSTEMLNKLKEVYDLIITGHEHTYHEGKCVRVGAVLPYSFSEMQDKVVLDVNINTMEYEKKIVWSAQDNFKLATAKEFLHIRTPIQFCEVVGNIEREELLPLSKHISELLSQDGCIAIRNNTALPDVFSEGGSEVEACHAGWREIVSSRLPDDLRELFRREVEDNANK